jgi:hypothetical protein
MQICRKTAEHSDRFGISSGWHSHPVLCVANIDAGRIVIDLRKPIQRSALRHTSQRITRAVEGWENNISTDWRS